MPPKGIVQGDAKKGTDVHISEKKRSGPPLMPSKRQDPTKLERQGQQRLPSRVMTATPAAASASKPLVRSSLLPTTTPVPAADPSKAPSSAAASRAHASFGLIVDKDQPAPELDTQWLALRRLQGRYIAGPHGDLLKADGVASGVTEPFFFSAVRPGSSANKRASGWFGKTVQPMLAANSLDDDAKKMAAAKKRAADSARSIDPNSTDVPRPASSSSPKKRKNPNPKTLREWVAFSFGGPQQINAGTLPVTKEIHAQVFPLVRADGNVEIASVAGKVIAAIAPTMPDAVEIATVWMESVAARDRAAAEDAAVSAAAAAAAAAEDSNNNNDALLDHRSEVGSASVSVSAADKPKPPIATRGKDEDGEDNAPTASLEPAPVGAPVGFIPYAVFLYAVRQLLSDERNIELAYDCCDVANDGVINKEAITRQVAVLMGKKDPSMQLATTTDAAAETMAATGASGVVASASLLEQQQQPLPTMRSPSGTMMMNQFEGATTIPSGSQSLAGGAAPTAISGATSFFGGGGGANKSNAGGAAGGGGGVRAFSPGASSTSGLSRPFGHNSTAALGIAAPPVRTLRQLHSDLLAEKAAYDKMREQHVLSTEEFVDDVIRSTTLGPEAPHRDRAPDPGRYWVTARPRHPPPLVPSPHFHFPISTALMRCFKHIAGFEEHSSLYKGKKKKKGATLPSMRQEHISRREFAEMFLADPHVCTPFLPFLLRKAIERMSEEELGMMPDAAAAAAAQQQQFETDLRSQGRSSVVASGAFPRRVESQVSLSG